METYSYINEPFRTVIIVVLSTYVSNAAACVILVREVVRKIRVALILLQ